MEKIKGPIPPAVKALLAHHGYAERDVFGVEVVDSEDPMEVRYEVHVIEPAVEPVTVTITVTKD
jgi:hypothetical protein